jgi:hypothetical protein
MIFQDARFDPETIFSNITCLDNVEAWNGKHDLGVICNAIANRECTQELLAAIYRISKKDDLPIPHPTISGIVTYPFFSKGFPNHSIFFIDEDLGCPWVLLQVFSFVDLIITPDQAFGLVSIPLIRNKDVIRAACEFGNKSLDLLRASSSIQKIQKTRPHYRGLLLNADRPFHFLFDELLYFFLIQQEVNLHFSPSFGQLAFVYDSSYGPKVCDNLAFSGFQETIYLRLKGVGVHVRTYTGELYESFTQMGIKLLEDNPSRPVPDIPGDSFVVWLGITGQKRSWIEQVDGYVEVIEFIGRIHRHVTLIIDGWTQPEGSNKQTPEDWDIAFEIIDKAKFHSNTRIVIAIDMNYSQKLRLCSRVDFFIANHGSGCIVPHILLRKPGILHSPYLQNGPNDAMSFPDICPSNAKRVPTEKVTLIGYVPNRTSPQHCSYSISPCDIIELIKAHWFGSIDQMDEDEFVVVSRGADSTSKQNTAGLLRKLDNPSHTIMSSGPSDWRESIKITNVIDISISLP